MTHHDELLQLKNDSVVLRAKLRALADELPGRLGTTPAFFGSYNEGRLHAYEDAARALREVLGDA